MRSRLQHGLVAVYACMTTALENKFFLDSVVAAAVFSIEQRVRKNSCLCGKVSYKQSNKDLAKQWLL